MAKAENNRFEILKDKGRIKASVLDVSSGLKVLEGVYAVRIHSRQFYALIMNDYLPTLGKVEGDVVFLNGEGEHSYKNIRGFYKHRHNEFTLLVEEKLESREAE